MEAIGGIIAPAGGLIEVLADSDYGVTVVFVNGDSSIAVRRVFSHGRARALAAILAAAADVAEGEG